MTCFTKITYSSHNFNLQLIIGISCTSTRPFLCWGAWESTWNAARGDLQRDFHAAEAALDRATLTATTGSEDPFSVGSKSFATAPSEHPLLDPE
jgi:hypothetical protein